jgi:hypothetical protein
VNNTLRFAIDAANSEAKTLVYHFSLANCPPCDRLDAQVLGTSEWKEYARQNLKVIDIFMPNQFTSEDVRIVKNMEILEAVTKAMDGSGGFPTMVVFSSDGRILDLKSGYDGGGVSRYISWLEKLRKSDPNRPTKPTPLVASAPAVESAKAPEPKAETPIAKAPMAEPAKAVALVDAKVESKAEVKLEATKTPPVEAPKAEPKTYLKLKGVLGGAQPMVMINSGVKVYTVGAGDELTMETPSGKIAVKCEAVSKDGVVGLVIKETKERVELRLQ